MQVISKDRYEQIVELLKSGDLAYAIVADRVNTPVATVVRIADGTHYHQTGTLALDERPKVQLTGRRASGRRGHRVAYLPTSEEITEVCEEIRETWDEERLARWAPPLITVRSLVGA